MSAAGGTIIKLKDNIHTNWFELQSSKRSNGHAFLSKPLYDEIVRLGHEALKELRETDPDSRFIKRVEQALHTVQLRSWIAEDIGYIGPTPYYVMTPEAGQTVITQDINRLANEIHQAGMSLIKARDQYCGCEISEGVEDISSINTGVLKYCEGALERGTRTAWIHEPGDVVEHRPGSAGSHVNRIHFVPTEKGHEIEMDYVESGDSNWWHRLNGVIAFVAERGGECETQDKMVRCTFENASDEDVLDIALMISQLKDIDLLLSNCIPLAFELILQQANELKTLEPIERIWKEPWTVVSDMAEIMDCTGPETDEERRDREEVIGRRLMQEIEIADEGIGYALEHAAKEPCTSTPYARICNVKNWPQEIYDNCQKIKQKTTDPFGWCLDLSSKREEEIKSGAKDLVDRCPPEGIILAMEASNMPYTVDRIARVCELAENQDCLDIIRQVEARAQADIKPAELKLKLKEAVSA